MTRPLLTKDEYIKKLLHVNRCLKQNIKGLQNKVINAEKMYFQVQNEYDLHRKYHRDAEWEGQELRILKEAVRMKGLDPDELIKTATISNDGVFAMLLNRARGIIRRKDAA